MHSALGTGATEVATYNYKLKVQESIEEKTNLFYVTNQEEFPNFIIFWWCHLALDKVDGIPSRWQIKHKGLVLRIRPVTSALVLRSNKKKTDKAKVNKSLCTDWYKPLPELFRNRLPSQMPQRDQRVIVTHFLIRQTVLKQHPGHRAIEIISV